MPRIIPQLVLTFSLTSVVHPTGAQEVQWMRQGGIGGAGRGVAADAAGNVYVAGVVNAPALFDQDTVAAHFADAFIAKYDAEGAIQWARTGGAALIDQANDIATDAEGNSYITGFFNTNGPNPTVEFDGQVLNGLGSTDLFVAKYAADGSLLWIRYGGGTLAEEGRGIAIAPSGAVVVSGYFQGTAVFGDDTLTSAGLSDALLLSYDAEGNALWAQRAGGPGDDKAAKLTALPDGDIAVVGHFQQNMFIGTDDLNASGLGNVFLARFDAAGQAVWGRSAGSAVDFAMDEAFDIAHAPNGDLIFCGDVAGEAGFDGLSIVPNGGIDLFIARYDGAGTALWVHHAGGPQVDHAYGIAVDEAGNSYLTGQADDGANTVFDTITLEPFGNEAVFLAKYDAGGAIQWVRRYAPGLGGAVHVLADECLYFTGGASGIVGQPAFDDIPWQYVDRAIFTARFCADGSTGVVQAASLGEWSPYPIPVRDVLRWTAFDHATNMTVQDAGGVIVMRTRSVDRLDVHSLPAGLYVLRAIDRDGRTRQARFVKE